MTSIPDDQILGEACAQGIYDTGSVATNYKSGYNPRKWPYKWIAGVINLVHGDITLGREVAGQANK